MANEIKQKFSGVSTLTITLASLASSSAGVGRQTTLVDNSTNRYGKIHVQFKVTTGTSPTANRGIYFFLIRSNATDRTDNAGSSDAAITVVTAEQVYAVNTTSTSDTAYQGSFIIEAPGVEWGLIVVQDTGANLNSTGGNHFIKWYGVNPEIQ